MARVATKVPVSLHSVSTAKKTSTIAETAIAASATAAFAQVSARRR